MKRIRLTAASLLAAGFLGVVGCGGGGRFVPVSGTIKVDGKPYDKGVISFQPIGGKDNMNPGMGSSAFTDANGRYELKAQDGSKNGAVVGKHRVRIATKSAEQAFDPTKGSPDGDVKAPSKASAPEIIPTEWNNTSEKTFDVPSGGTDKADFDIESKKGKKP